MIPSLPENLVEDKDVKIGLTVLSTVSTHEMDGGRVISLLLLAHICQSLFLFSHQKEAPYRLKDTGKHQSQQKKTILNPYPHKFQNFSITLINKRPFSKTS